MLRGMPTPDPGGPGAPSSSLASPAAADPNVVQAVQVARLYYQQGLTTDAIARELGLSRPRVSRLLTLARRTGLVEIRIHDPQEHPQHLEAALRERWPALKPQVIGLPANAPQDTRMERVAQAAAHWLGTHLRARMTVGIAWGNTLDAVSQALMPRPLADTQFVQLNGSASAYEFNSGFVTDTVLRFARAFGGRAHLFPVPTFFDDPHTKQAMWRERSVGHITTLQAQADMLVFSVGSFTAATPSHVHTAGYLDDQDLTDLAAQGVTGDIATVFFRADGSSRGIHLNDRASGPDLNFVREHPSTVCIVADPGKASALHAALQGQLARTLIVDEMTARAVLELS
ncbi:sugar-binding transcriptional regulator [Deinococcus cavernae]|uniref:Sugar-binding transcriptional regulator n=2 Tax=Deinococcus cavernae TaxID=2320857 RepID=A0A418VAK3_9DEIO|nr:sugar-binding transcriptional regulator [Deinococcus cavernae]